MKKYLLPTLFLMLSLPSYAAETVCTGKIERIMTFKNGRLATRLVETQKVYVLCDQSYQGCSAVLANLLANEARQEPVDLVFSGATYGSCDEIPNWANMIEDFSFVRSLP